MKAIPRIYLFFVLILCIGCDQFNSDKKTSESKKTTTDNFVGIEKADDEFLLTVGFFNQNINTVYLYKSIANKLVLVDSADINNQFQIKGKIESPSYYVVKTDASKASYKFLVDASYMDIFINDPIRNSVTYSPSTLQTEYRTYTKKINEFKSRGVALYYGMQGDFSAGKINQLKKDRAKLFGEQSHYTTDFITNNPDSYFSAMLLKDNLGNYTSKKSRELYDGLSTDLRQQAYVLNIDSLISAKKAIVTKPIPVKKTTTVSNTTSTGEYRPNAYSFSGKNTYGETMTLNSIPRGKVVLLDFWASWCAPCRATNPDLVTLYNKYNSQGFEIMSISEDKNEADWMNAIVIDDLAWDYHVLDKNMSIAFRYGVEAIPFKILIDKQGRIASGKISGRSLELRIKELLRE